jgi:antitoxin VapB
VNEKDRRLADFCKRRGYDGALLRRRTNIAWLTDGADVHVDSSGSTGVAALLWTPRRKVVLCTNIESRRLAEEEFSDEWTVRESKWWEGREQPSGRLATDFPDDPFADLRASLTDLEAHRVRELGAVTATELARTMKAVRPGWTEHEVAGEITGRLRRLGIFTPVVLVASDARIAKYRHPIPTSKRVEKRLMVAVCPRHRGLMIAMTRLVHFGKKLPSDLRRRHDAVCRVDAALHAATRPGARWCDILAAGIRVYRETGFADEWKKHHQGGPMGYEGRDFVATPAETRLVQPRQVVGWNPSVTGTKSEDTILSDREVLTRMPDWPMNGSRPDILCRG